MRLIRFIDPDGRARRGIDLGDGSAELLGDAPLPSPGDGRGETLPIARRLAPIKPVNIFAIGLNYRDHARETGAALPEHPVVFMKPTSSVTGPDAAVVLPAAQLAGPEVDSEAELAVVIGRPAKDVAGADALDYVYGYTCANDVSARRWQKQGGGGQWVRGKSFDSFCPLGPCVVSADELPDPQNLKITGRLNDRPMQEGHSSAMIFSVAALIAFLSRDTTLLPGTVILTGTPAGVGLARTPPVFLAAGDCIDVEIEGIGRLSNPVVDAGA